MKKAVSQRMVRRRATLRLSLYGLLAFSLAGPLLNATTRPSLGTSITMFCIFSLTLWKLVKWIRALRVSRLFPQYVHALDTTHTGRTRDLADSLGQPQERMKRDLKAMSGLGLLPEVAFNRDGTYALMGAHNQPLSQWRQEMRQREKDAEARARAQRKQEEAALARQARQAAKVKGARCAGCGAQVRVTQGLPTPCAYCGTLR